MNALTYGDKVLDNVTRDILTVVGIDYAKQEYILETYINGKVWQGAYSLRYIYENFTSFKPRLLNDMPDRFVTMYNEVILETRLSCECGAHKADSPAHATWCPIKD